MNPTHPNHSIQWNLLPISARHPQARIAASQAVPPLNLCSRKRKQILVAILWRRKALQRVLKRLVRPSPKMEKLPIAFLPVSRKGGLS